MNRFDSAAAFSPRGAGPPRLRVALLFAVLFGYVLWPILLVLVESVWRREGGFTFEPWRQFVALGHGVYALRTIGISLATVALAGALGTSLAFYYFRLEFPGRSIFAALTLLPFTLPPLVGVFAIWTLMGEEGLFHRATRAILPGGGFWIETGYTGVLLVHAYSMFVYFYVLVGGALSGFDESQIEAARDLGAGRARTFLRVVLPQLAPAWAGASLLAFMTSMASFTAPYYYMSGRPVLTVGIQQAWERPELAGLASVDCVILTLCATGFLFVLLRFERSFEGGAKGAARRRLRLRSTWARWALVAGAVLMTLVILAPHLTIARESLVESGTGFFNRPAEYTLEHYAALWRDAESRRPAINSLRAAGLATAATTAFALTSAWLIVRRRFVGRAIARALIMLPFALPGTVIAVGLLWMTGSGAARPIDRALTFGLDLRGSILILALAYFIRLMPLAHRTIRAGLLAAPVELEMAARDLGATSRQCFLRVTLPLIAPAVLIAATLVFVTALGEFVSSLLLYELNTEPIAVKIDRLRRAPGGRQLAAAYSVMLMLGISGVFVLARRRGRRPT